jgi:two-component system phosphate regulon sensor histidine kinase PhoR
MSRIFPRRSWSDSSRRLTLVFAGVLVPAAVALVWLGAQLLDQDRALWAQREAERLEAAADALVRALGQSMVEAERKLTEATAADGAVLIQRSANSLVVHPQGMTAWSPLPASLSEISPRAFEAAERLEFQGSKDAALAEYRRLAQSVEFAEVRVGALLRAARVNRALGKRAAAIADYRALSQHQGFAAGGAPIDLLARRRICELLLESGDEVAHQREAELLARDFSAGRWSLARHDWEITLADISRWSGPPTAAVSTQRALSTAIEWLTLTEPPRAAAGRRLVTADDLPVTLLWRGTGEQLSALAFPVGAIERWVMDAVAQHPPGAVRLALLTDAGAPMTASGLMSTERTTRRSAADTGLPWTLTVAPGDTWSIGDEFASRRRLLMAGLLALGLVLAAGSYLLWRVVQRELAVARLQAEFVSAVSHEFRTPVTSLRHVIELLQEDDELPKERRRSFYEVLGRSTERLDRLVESLLDFGRMEDGRKPYDLRSIDAVAFARSVAADFEKNAQSDGHRITVDVVDAPGLVRADEAALGHALWNLLDNAVKYSPAGGPITISVGPHRLGSAITVRDSGLGVPREEQRDIFTKFVRGAQAHRLGIKGTGVGLAIVSHIVHAHGGRLELESEEGKGSAFRLVLPSAA